MCSGSVLDMLNSSLAYWFGRPASLSGKLTGGLLSDDTCRLNSNTAPSALASCRKASAGATGSPSFASPSVRFRMTGGKQDGCSLSQPDTTDWALVRAPTIGVPPLATGSTQIGNLISCSTRPPAPSGTFLARFSNLAGFAAISLSGTRIRPASDPANAGPTFDPP